MRETLWSCLGLPHSKSSIFPTSTHSATLTPLVTCTAVHRPFLTIYAALWNVAITLMQYDVEMSGSRRTRGLTNLTHSSDCLWQMEMRNLTHFGEPWRFGHFRGSPKLRWFFLQWEAELLQDGEDSNSWSTSCLGNRRNTAIKSVQTRLHIFLPCASSSPYPA